MHEPSRAPLRVGERGAAHRPTDPAPPRDRRDLLTSNLVSAGAARPGGRPGRPERRDGPPAERSSPPFSANCEFD